MSGAKETPRQKMIGMMYLVYTAMLALNVSKDILNAFTIVNDGLLTSLENTTSKNDLIYANFAKSMLENPGKVKPYYDNAIKAQNYATELVNYINDLRISITAYAEFGIKEKSADPAKWAWADTMSVGNIQKKDNYDMPMEILIGQSEDGSGGKGMELKKKLEEYKKNMIGLLMSQKDKESAAKSFPINTEDAYSKNEGRKLNWVIRNFYHTVLVADIALLNKLIIDVKSVEGDVIAKLFSSVDASSFKFDQIVAKVVAPSSYILAGNEYKANIFLAAYDSKKSPDIYIGSDTINHTGGQLLDKAKFENGMGVYTAGAAGIGEQKYTGWISLVKPGETSPTYYNFSSSYFVGKPSATVSADKMNVFYIGVANPVSISVPGVPATSVKPSISAGTLKPLGNGKYEVWVNTGTTKVTINVAADMGGKVTSMGSAEFRVKRIPDPTPMIANSKGGNVSKSALASASGIIPYMEGFDFDLNFLITGYTFTMNVRGDLLEKNVGGNKLTPDIQKMIQGAAKGTKVYFENIKAKGPDGSSRALSSISLKLQ